MEESDVFSADEKCSKKRKAAFSLYDSKKKTYFMGNGQITFTDGTKIRFSYCRPIALRSDSIEDIVSATVSCETIMTIENLTSFNWVCSENMFCLFLSGYNNSCKTKFLKKMFKDNSHKEWLHFGGIDPDGFLILYKLRIKTGIDLKPYRMGITELADFKKFCKPLEENDIAKAKSMSEKQLFPEIVRFMLDNNCKLEQEIVSWKNK